MLTVNNLTLTLHHRPLLREIAFSVSPGEVLTLMGPSGSGKSTLFAWMIGALEAPFHASGELWLYNERCDERPTERRRIGILFQDALLFDHFSVGQNLLLDEPFNRLDAELRAGFRRWVFDELARLAIPAVLVTHDSGDIPDRGRCLNIRDWQ
ncbi:ATP-binding cassette domain-containing protein [Raoultella ornithinolytica]|uniref:ATP-binding cassette domain-containing protein n=1 Tax=Raoultella ornithinolytica TaxID=54291 RepID=UPI00384E775A